MKKTDPVKLTLADGTVKECTAQQLRNFLNATLKKPRAKLTGFCPTLDCDEEGFVKPVEDALPGAEDGGMSGRTVTIEAWYTSKNCPRCHKTHKFPMQAKWRP